MTIAPAPVPSPRPAPGRAPAAATTTAPAFAALPSTGLPAYTTMRELERGLAREYAGLVAPGRVIAVVVRAAQGLRRIHIDTATQLDLVEIAARNELSHLVGESVAEQTEDRRHERLRVMVAADPRRRPRRRRASRAALVRRV